jgi:hypothetical protein
MNAFSNVISSDIDGSFSLKKQLIFLRFIQMSFFI